MTDPHLSPSSDDDPVTNLRNLQARIAEAAKSAGRNPSEITLVAVSKTHGPDHIAPFIDAGHRVFGENRVQEATGKWPILRESQGDLELHLSVPRLDRGLRPFDERGRVRLDAEGDADRQPALRAAHRGREGRVRGRTHGEE